MSATSSRTRAAGGLHTFMVSAIAASGVFAMLSSMIQWAVAREPEQLGALGAQGEDLRDHRLVVVLPAASPRDTHIFHTFSRRSRRDA
jgi:hypothetical protein